MSRALVVAAVLISSSCLTTVDQRWCDAQTPCSTGFVCTSTFHCIPAPATSRDAGVGGGAGGGSGGGGGRPVGGGAGGGAPACETFCTGCCLNNQCLQFEQQSAFICGVSGARCMACAGAEICSERGCVVRNNPDGGALGSVGSACEQDSECGSDMLGMCIPEFSGGEFTGWPGGYCSRSCDFTACPGTDVCVEADQGGSSIFICLDGCQTDTECRMGYECVAFENAGVCVPN